MTPIIRLEKLCFHYPDTKKGVTNISWDIYRHHKIALMGLNGAGKSTLFFLLSGVYRPNSGIYYLNGKVLGQSKRERQSLGKTVGYVFQDPDVQLFAPSVWEDVAFGVRNMKLSKKTIHERVQKYLELVGILHLKDVAPHQLSYGQKKLVAIAGVLVMEPEIIILDEPFAWLDNVQQKNMKNLLYSLHKQGTTLIVSTHDMQFAFSWATHGLVLNNGTIATSGSIEELRSTSKILCDIGLDIP